VGLTTLPCKKNVEKPPRNSAGFCGGGQGLSGTVEPRKEEEDLLNNNYLQDIILALQEFGYDVSVKQVTIRSLTSEGSVTIIFLSSVPGGSSTLPEVTANLRSYQSLEHRYKDPSMQDPHRPEVVLQLLAFSHVWIHCKQPTKCLWIRSGHGKQ
jgi:hypothetical protein